MQGVAVETALASALKGHERQIKGMSSGLLRTDTQLALPTPPATPVEVDSKLSLLHFPCCNETVKLEQQEEHFCPICGMEKSPAPSFSSLLHPSKMKASWKQKSTMPFEKDAEKVRTSSR